MKLVLQFALLAPGELFAWISEILLIVYCIRVLQLLMNGGGSHFQSFGSRPFPHHIRSYIRCWSQFGNYLGQAAQLAILFKAFFSSFRASGSCNKKGPKQRLKQIPCFDQKIPDERAESWIFRKSLNERATEYERGKGSSDERETYCDKFMAFGADFSFFPLVVAKIRF